MMCGPEVRYRRGVSMSTVYVRVGQARPQATLLSSRTETPRSTANDLSRSSIS